MTTFHFIVDENLPPHLAHWLMAQGQTATHVNYESLASTSDHDIWTWAANRNAIVVSKDEDFHNRLVAGKPPRFVWVRWGNTRKSTLMDRFERFWPIILQTFSDGDWLVELTDLAP